MTKHKRMLMPGASHGLWCSVILGLLWMMVRFPGRISGGHVAT